MEKITLSGIEIEIKTDGEILGMGGPSVGAIFVGGKHIADSCVLNNFVVEETNRLLFFVKYDFSFTINFYDLKSESLFEFDKKFSMVHIKRFITPTQLEIFHAFHDQLPQKRDVFDLDKEAFSEVQHPAITASTSDNRN